MNKIDMSTLPSNVSSQLLSKENTFYFSYITFKGGCASNSSLEDHWICLTDKRILYKSKIKEENNITLIEKNGIIPFEKISFIEITKAEQNTGCSDVKCYELRIGSSGGTTIIPIPTEEKGFEVRKIYMELLEMLKDGASGENAE